MTEKEKMLKGLIYNANYDDELASDHIKCADLCNEYNKITPSDIKRREDVLRKIVAKTGKSFFVEQDFRCGYGYNIEIGENFYSNYNLVILDCAKVVFGNNVFIAPNCAFYTAGHPIDTERRNSGLEYAYPITVEDNVWIGGNTVVLPGVTIGHDTVIGAGSVVNKDIPSGVVAAGNPCKVLRNITEKDKESYITPSYKV